MAGAGWKDFVPGQVLAAADVQDYLQDQSVMVFASAAARTSALASPSEGMVSYLKDTDTVERFDGSSWVAPWSVANGGTGATTVAGAQDSLGVGLTNIIPSSVNYVAGSGSTGANGTLSITGCTSVEINGVFSSSYQNYRIVFKATGSANGLTMFIRGRTTTNESDPVYFFSGYNAAIGGAVGLSSGVSQTHAFIGNAAVQESTHSLIDVLSPNLAARTSYSSRTFGHTGTAYVSHGIDGIVYTTKQYTGLQLGVLTGNITGTLTVYGYND